MKNADNLPIMSFETQENWEAWLKEHHTDTKDIWIEVKAADDIDCSGLKEIPGVTAVTYEDGIIKINSNAEVNNLNKVIQYLMTHHIEIKAVKEQAPNLETVFLTLTGRSLRDL